MVAAFTAFYISQLELTQMCVINCENNNGYFAVRLMARVDYGAPVRCYILMKHSMGRVLAYRRLLMYVITAGGS